MVLLQVEQCPLRSISGMLDTRCLICAREGKQGQTGHGQGIGGCTGREYVTEGCGLQP